MQIGVGKDALAVCSGSQSQPLPRCSWLVLKWARAEGSLASLLATPGMSSLPLP